MQYDAIILELMSRIQSLEQTVGEVNRRISALENAGLSDETKETADSSPEEPERHRQKMTEEMILACYACAVRLDRQEGLDFNREVADLARRTGMKKSSAIMYVYAVKNMRSGTVYKRAINQTATERFFQRILQDDGTAGLEKALRATRAHIAYRQQLGHTVDGLIALCDRYEGQAAGSGRPS